MKMFLQLDDGAVSIAPKVLCLERMFRKVLGVQDLRVNACNQNLFIIGTVEDPNAASRRQSASRTPQEVVLELLLARLFETKYFTSLPGSPLT